MHPAAKATLRALRAVGRAISRVLKAAAWPAVRAALAAAATALLILLVLGLAITLWGLVELWRDSYRTATFIGMNAPKALAIGAAALILLVAFPLATLDGVASARFRRLERDLRERRPHDAVAPHDGPEGQGLLFDGPTGRVLLLSPPGGFGRPRVVELPPPEPAPEAPSGPAGVPSG